MITAIALAAAIQATEPVTSCNQSGDVIHCSGPGLSYGTLGYIPDAPQPWVTMAAGTGPDGHPSVIRTDEQGHVICSETHPLVSVWVLVSGSVVEAAFQAEADCKSHIPPGGGDPALTYCASIQVRPDTLGRPAT